MTTVIKEDVTNTCQYCHKTYSSKSNLKAHQQRTKKCIDTRTNAIMRELIISKEKSDKLESSLYEEIPMQENIPPNNQLSGCKDCGRVNSQLSSILALNNKMFIQMLDMCKHINNLSIVVENSTNKVLRQITQKTQC
ncbi:MAG: C2H2-type zinc finger protein [Candidatus Colwellbacteria bacterium]|nr:C2H2-type zinc finger protein [Candidatus Colwellbacteria bacterium]